ncbi:LOW QUALITY PROTEIN: putative olfactory receptor 14L1 [Manis pentadactyla]|uniref:LOW QUALITY PROTEIN: putative olfactory receptor 14L1 n=1 Tax=Manis pentadactyla TaxID=143292 RepID=UPI00255CB2F8|nr:LOW QUALITY PROTEIN: putative olfactory receptor 14L1 [Manis pentadactyla]
MANVTVLLSEFVLMGFSDIWELQVLHAVVFFLIYLTALIGNLLIILLITLDQHLHSPMHFFLRTLSLLDVCFISVTVPKAITQSLTQNSSISFLGCAVQVFLVVLFACAELALLTVMSYDRYVAMCHPLHYQVMMRKGACEKMVAASWFSGAVSGFLNTSVTSLPFCWSDVIHQFFCEIPSLLRLSYSERFLAEIGAIIATTSLGILRFTSILVSYPYIFSTVLRIPSVEGRSKVFSTCIPHLVVVIVFLSTGSITYLKPTSESPSIWDLIVSVFYTVAPPTLNSIVYSLKNRDMQAAFWKMLRKTVFIHRNNKSNNNNTATSLSSGKRKANSVSNSHPPI